MFISLPAEDIGLCWMNIGLVEDLVGQNLKVLEGDIILADRNFGVVGKYIIK